MTDSALFTSPPVVTSSTDTGCMASLIGIRNPGALCYLIAVVQQLYRMPKVSALVRALPVEVEVEAESTAKALEPANKGLLLVQAISALKLLFNDMHSRELVSMEDRGTDDVPIDIVPLWKSMSLYFNDGLLVEDINCQQDAIETYSRLVQILERYLCITTAVTQEKKEGVAEGRQQSGACRPLHGLLRGSLVHLLETNQPSPAAGAADKRTIEKLEAYSFISLGVLDKDSMIDGLEDSLRAFTRQEEIMLRWPATIRSSSSSSCSTDPSEGTARPAVSAAVSTLKSTRLRSAPTYLCIQLRKFRFDIMTMSKQKIHDEFSFPNLLDLSPYMSPAASADMVGGGEECRYALSGCVVHRGREATSGHYYSYVRHRSCSGGRAGDWYALDDQLVYPVALDEVLKEVFGGVRLGDDGGPVSSSGGDESNRSSSDTDDDDEDDDDSDRSNDSDDSSSEDSDCDDDDSSYIHLPASAIILFYDRL